MRPGERQVSETVDGIRRDHVARYEWAAKLLPQGSSVIDFACGVGYGTHTLAAAGHKAVGFDIDAEAIGYARKHYAGAGAKFERRNGASPGGIEEADAAVCFETIEHIEDPRPLLKALHTAAPRLLASVPNESVFPWHNIAYHYRHYTAAQFEALLNECGWKVIEWWGQAGPESEVERDCQGRTIIAACERGALPRKQKAPEHVAILGLGPSLDQYTNVVKRLGGRHRFSDETWTINALGQVFACDRIFHMDDVRIQELRAEARPESNIAAMLEWLRDPPVPVITSRPHPDYPHLQPFPLVEVLDEFRTGYFNSTAAYAVAYAIWLGVKKISIFGCDYTYPNAHDAEKGRACVEYWLGIAAERGIKIAVPKNTTLLDAIHTQRERFYGYDTLDLAISEDQNGRLKIDFRERQDLPSADEVEAAYDHSAHPNALVRGQ